MKDRMTKAMPFLIALLLAMVTISSWDVITKRLEGYGPAIEWHGVEVLTKTVRPGGEIEMVYSATIHRQCPAELRGFIVADDGSVPVRYPIIAGGYSLPSETPVNIRVAVTMPMRSDPGLAELQSGPYVYRTLATRYCPGGIETDNFIPDAPFNLEVPE